MSANFDEEFGAALADIIYLRISVFSAVLRKKQDVKRLFSTSHPAFYLPGLKSGGDANERCIFGSDPVISIHCCSTR